MAPQCLAGARGSIAPPASGRAALARRATAALPARRPTGRSATVTVRAGKDPNGPKVAIAGISGAVGQEFIRVLTERNFPYSEMKMLASKRSAGKTVEFDGETYTIEELTAESFDNVDIALFSAGGSISKDFGPLAAEKVGAAQMHRMR